MAQHRGLAGTCLDMAGGVIVGILRERHADYIVLRDGTQVYLNAKQAAGELAIGTSLTVSYTIKKGGKKMADTIWRCD
jgi:hypothetical protein